ncbi:MAG TPA: hypothetical protein VHR47_11995, partial [Bacillota bacterium]|nr:hypothetical protein [Bacillota bacterium]
MREVTKETSFSLLWPEGTGRAANHWAWVKNETLVEDMNLSELALAISYDQFHPVTLDKLLQYVTDDPATLTYRLDIIDDLLANPGLLTAIENTLPLIDELEESVLTDARGSNNDPPFIQTVRRLGELEVYVDCIHKLQTGFTNGKLQSIGLTDFRRKIASVYEDPDFMSLVDELPKLRTGFSALSSVTLGINLDSQLRPSEATLISINDERFQGGSILNRFTGKRRSDTPYQGISPLIKIERIYNFEDNQWITQGNPFHTAIFTELNHIVGALAKPIAAEIKQYTKFNSRLLVGLKSDLVFFLGVLRFIQRIQGTGLPISRPV